MARRWGLARAHTQRRRGTAAAAESGAVGSIGKTTESGHRLLLERRRAAPVPSPPLPRSSLGSSPGTGRDIVDYHQGDTLPGTHSKRDWSGRHARRPGEAHGETSDELAARDGARSGGAGRGHSRGHRFERGACNRQTGAGDTMGAVASRSGGSD